jgi:hypothetical protein
LAGNKELLYLKLKNLKGFEVMKGRWSPNDKGETKETGLWARNEGANCLLSILTNNRTVVDLDIFDNETTKAEFIKYHSSIFGSYIFKLY